MQAPPPPIQPKKSSWPLLIGIGGFMLVMLIAVCAFGGYKISQIVKEPPKPMANSGKPTVVSKMDDGWTRYRFPEGPFEFSLPGEPKFDAVEFERIDSLAITEYTYYDVEADVDVLQLAAFRYRNREMVDLKDEAEAVMEEIKSSDLKQVSGGYTDKTIGGLTGKEVSITFDVEGVKGECRVFVWAEDTTVYMVQAFFYGDKQAGEFDYRRVVESFKPG